MKEQINFNKVTGTHVNANAPLILIYSPIPSPRLAYVCGFIFNRVLHVNFKVVTDVSEFENSQDFRINFSGKNINGAVQIIPHSLIFETGVTEIKPEPFVKDGLLYFFKNEGGELPFDLFSAVFYFIARYEEYQDYEKDKHGRFEAKESLLFRNKFHLKPVVDYWVLELKKVLQLQYPGLTFPEKKFQVISTIDVDNLFAYRHKGLLRTIGAALKDLIKNDFKNFKLRLRVLFGKDPDPFDIYDDVSAFCLAHEIPICWFFLFKAGTRHDRTISPGSNAFTGVFETLRKNKAFIGLHPSYDSVFKDNMLKRELDLFKLKLKKEVSLSRQHYLRFDIRTTPALLLKNGLTTDFSMGFASTPGFRAGTSHPFPYFDFETETEQALVFVPFCSMDGAYFVYDKISPDEAFNSLMDLAIEIRKTTGFFISVFHERTFSNHLYPGFGSLYKNLHLQLKEL